MLVSIKWTILDFERQLIRASVKWMILDFERQLIRASVSYAGALGYVRIFA